MVFFLIYSRDIFPPPASTIFLTVVHWYPGLKISDLINPVCSEDRADQSGCSMSGLRLTCPDKPLSHTTFLFPGTNRTTSVRPPARNKLSQRLLDQWPAPLDQWPAIHLLVHIREKRKLTAHAMKPTEPIYCLGCSFLPQCEH